MKHWKGRLAADSTGWLLERTNPSVRYWTLTDILDRSDNDPEVQDAKAAIAELPSNQYRQVMLDLADSLLERRR